MPAITKAHFCPRVIFPAAMLICMLLLLTPHAYAADYAGGNGTQENPYKISTAAHLNNVRKNLGAYYVMTADITFTAKDFAEGGTYYNGGQGWVPIGNQDAPFTGSFDGAGHTVSGLYQNIVRSEGGGSVVRYVCGGLFGAYNSGSKSIRNLGVINADIQVKNTYTGGYIDGQEYAGCVVGYVANGTIENCWSSGSVTCSNNGCYSVAGGIAGHSRSITGCRNFASVQGGNVGGIAGNANMAQISKCCNAGTIAAPGGNGMAGGITADAYTVINCYNTGTVTSGYQAGGIAARVYTKLQNCYNAGFGARYGITADMDESRPADNCYYLDCHDKGIYRSSSATTPDPTVQCTAAQMQLQSTFVGFDFDTVWTFDPSTGYKLPVLRDVPHAEPANNTTVFSGGNGKAYNPYLISSVRELNNIRNYLPGCFKLVQDILFTEDDYAQGGICHNSGLGWNPIGTYSEPFVGSLDGDGKTICGLRIQGDNPSTTNYGLFGYAANTQIKNLNLTEVAFDITDDLAYVGSIVGNTTANTVIITNCAFSGRVNCVPKYGNNHVYIGGIAGYGCTLRSCRGAGEVNVTVKSPSSCYVGGLAGWYCSVADSSNSAAVSVRGTGATLTVGGVSGGYSTSYQNVSNSSNTGAVTATVTTGTAKVGGIAGEVGAVRNCSNTGAVTATATTGTANAGGIASAAGTVEKSWNSGVITASTDSGTANAGGIASRNPSGKCLNSYNTGAVTGANAGGIAGASGGTVSTCYNVGAVTGTAAGGIVGVNSGSGTVTDCYFAADTADTLWGDGTEGAAASARADMHLADTFAGFDFDTVWDMEGNEDYLFPELAACPTQYKKTLLGIAITTPPTKTVYLQDEMFSAAGLVVTASYDNGTTQQVNPTLSWTTAFVGTQTVTATYQGMTATFQILVQEDPLLGLAKAVGFTYDSAAGTARLENVSPQLRLVLAAYLDGRMLLCRHWIGETGELSFTLPEGTAADRVAVFITDSGWRPLCPPKKPDNA